MTCFPASPYTQLFWNEFQVAPHAAHYNLVMDQTIYGELDISKLRSTIKKLSEHYILCHHRLIIKSGELLWQKSVHPELQLFDEEQSIINLVYQPFDLTNETLLRVGLLKQGKSKFNLILVMHHVLIDGVAGNELYDVISAIYNTGNLPQSIDSNIINKNIARYNDNIKKLESDYNTAAFWKEALQDLPFRNELPYIHSPIEQSNPVGAVSFTLPFVQWELLKKNTKYANPFLIFKTIWAILIARICQQKSINILYPISIAAKDGMIMGAQVNTVIFPLHLQENDCFSTIYQRTLEYTRSHKLKNGLRHTHWPIFNVLSQHTLKINASFTQANLQDSTLNLIGCKTEFNHRFNIDISSSELIMEYQEKAHSFDFRIRYRNNLFAKKQMEDLAEQYQHLLNSLLSEPGRPLKEIAYLTDAQQQQQDQWNNTDMPLTNETLISLLEKQAIAHPERLALIDNKSQLTYAELLIAIREQAAHISNCYQQATGSHLQANTLIPICFHRGITSVVALLAVLKAGAAYVPLDPDAPEKRVSYILNDIGSPIIVTEKSLQQQLTHCHESLSFCLIDEQINSPELAIDPPLIQANKQDLAYAIYTSGTTGDPKGTLLTHQAVVNTIQAHIKQLQLNTETPLHCLGFASFVFDAHVLEIFTALCGGHQLYIASETQRHDLNELLQKLAEWQINLALMPPSLLAIKPKLPSSLNQLALGGEACSQEVFDHYTSEGRTLFNLYGPTEAAICVSINQYKYNGAKNIGQPISNIKTYILDQNLQPLPIGVIGELVIAGIGLAQSYWQLPELTKSSFIANPFSTDKKYNRIYRTGDLARRLTDGTIEYIGRNDFQVKIHGHRIELAEIESQIMRLPGIKAAVVIVRGAEEPRLLAYYVQEKNELLTHGEIYQSLTQVLPHYMLPASIVEIDHIPLNINKKVDWNALPDPEVLTDNTDQRMPATELEMALQTLWQEVLGKNLGIDSNFFQSGGNSILAIQLSYKIQQNLNKVLSIATINQYPTIATLAGYLAQENRENSSIEVIKALNLERAPLSYAQSRLWFMEHFHQVGNVYHIPILFKLAENSNITAYQQALSAIVQRHKILHSIIQQDKQGRAWIQRTGNSFKTEQISLSPTQWQTYLQTEINKSFDLTKEIPIRSTICQLTNENSDKSYFSLLTIHHIAFDGWSLFVLIKELETLYSYYNEAQDDSFHYEHKNTLPAPLPIQYSDYAQWQESYLTEENLTNCYDFWLNKLAEVQALDFPTDFPRPAIFDSRGKNHTIQFPDKLVERINQVKNSHHVTLFSILFSALTLLLSRYTRQQDIIIGTPVANRPLPVLDQLIGCFVNSLPLYNSVPENITITEFIRQIFNNTLLAQDYQAVPFEKLVDKLKIARDLSHNPLFQIMFTLEEKVSNGTDWLTLLDVSENYDAAKFDITVTIKERADGISAVFNYAVALFHPKTIEQLSQHYIYLLQQMVTHLDAPLSQLSLMPESAIQQLIQQRESTVEQYDYRYCLHDNFIHYAQESPDATALIDEQGSLTYAELYQQSLTLSNQLRQLKESDQSAVIAISLNKGRAQVIAILAILMTGKAYLPMDLSWPEKRQLAIMQQSAAYLMLRDSPLTTRDTEIKTILLTAAGEAPELAPVNRLAAPIKVMPQALAYIIFTSGSTGIPKGVAIPHQNVMNTILDINRRFNVSPQDRSLAISALSFDLSVYDIFGLLNVGGTVIIPNEQQRYQPAEIYRLIMEHDVSIWISVPILMELLLDYVYSENKLTANKPALRTVMVGGDWIATTLPQRLINWVPDCQFNSVGGATECSIISILYPVPSGKITSPSIPYGKAMTHQRFYILDEQLRPVPAGVKGELFIAGAGVGAGYYRDPVRTVESYFFHEKLGERLYRTGDFSRYLPDGNIEFMGRIDQQVKINGYRIELGEVESALLAISRIKSCHVQVYQKNKNQFYLVAYYVPNNAIALDKEHLVQHMTQQVPQYMVPAVYIALEELPLNANSKVDRDKLPTPIFEETHAYTPPETEWQRLCCTIWGKLLDNDQVGIDDNFFSLGGSSILAIQACHQLSATLAVEVLLSDLVQYPTIRQLCSHLLNREPTNAISTIPPLQQQEYPLSSAQMRLWFIENLAPGSNLYHVPILYKLSTEINLSAYKQSLIALVQRHQVLHSHIEQLSHTAARQKITNELLVVEHKHLSTDQWDATLQQAIDQPFALQQEIPIRAILYEHTDQRGHKAYYNLIVVHHIAFDGWSQMVMQNELELLYRYFSGECDQRPAKLTIQYGDYAVWQLAQLNNERIKNLNQFWLDKLMGWEHLELPIDFIRPHMFDPQGENHLFELSASLANKLNTRAQQLEVSLHAILLAGFTLLLSYYSGQKDIIIGTPVANRPEKDLQNLIGFFVNSIPLRNKVDMQLTVDDFIQSVFNNTLACLQHQDLPFEYLVDKLNLPRDLSRHPLFQVMFTLEQYDKKQHTESWLQLKKLDQFYKAAKFDLSLAIIEQAEKIEVIFNYACALFSPESITTLGHYFTVILQQLADNGNKQLKEISLLSHTEIQQLVRQRESKTYQYQFERNIHDDFMQQVKKQPNAVVVIDSLGNMTYQELYQAALTLSNQLRQHTDIDSIEVVAVVVDKGRALLTAIMAILMAGKAYLPMDQSWPEMRRLAVAKQAKTHLILSTQPWASDTVTVILLDHYGNTQSLPKADALYPPVPVAASALAYTIFTSGSTGTPKGVAIEHRGAVNSIIDTNRKLALNNQDKAFAISATSFDISAYDLFGILAIGGSLVMPNESQRYQPEAWYQLIMEHQVTFWNSAPSVLELLIEYVESQNLLDLPPAIHSVIMVGEVIPTSLPARFRRWAPNCRMISMGGATESSIWSIFYDIPQEKIKTPSVPYGIPLAHQRFYILDEQQRPLPTGFKGEQYIGGEGVAREYINDQETTNNSFFIHPQLGERLYRTGDLGRYLSDGNIEFMGRVDYQVQFNGYRIELGEIENLILQFPGIKSCRVIVYEDSTQKCLAAYYISENQTIEQDLIQYLYSQLPSYMIPTAYIALESFPLNSSGKLDRKALPIPKIRESANYIAPENALEEKLCALWEETLNLDKIGMENDFFTLGGTSILAMSTSLSLSQALNQTVPVAYIFQYRTLRGILNALNKHYQLIQPITQINPQHPNFWLIHPALVGVEAFYPFATKAEGLINCYGVDNYNLYHTPINKLSDLAAHYLGEMEQLNLVEQPIRILGWSLGGLIALKMALLLENRGITDIHLYLLDTFHQADIKSVDETARKQLFKQLGITDEMAARALAISAVEDELSRSTLSRKLQHTEVTLFKATQPHSVRIINEEKMASLLAMKENGIGALCRHLNVIELPCHHHNILEHSDEIIKEIMEVCIA